MTRIQSILKGSAGELLSGFLEIKLDARIIETTTTPDTIFFPTPQTFEVSNGALDINLIPSSNVTYNFRLYRTQEVDPEYWLADGTKYNGSVHSELFAEENGQIVTAYFTGGSPSNEQVRVWKTSYFRQTDLINFKALVPDTEKIINFSDLMPSGLTLDTLDTSVLRLADVIVSNPVYQTALKPHVVISTNTAIPDTSLGNNQISFWIDGDVLRVKLKTSSGVIKQGGDINNMKLNISAQLNPIYQAMTETEKAAMNFKPIFQDFGRYYVKRIRAQFDRSVNPYDEAWEPLSRLTIKIKRKKGYSQPTKPLIATGLSRRSIRFDARPNRLTFIFVTKYLWFHDSGTKNIPQRMVFPTEERGLDDESYKYLIDAANDYILSAWLKAEGENNGGQSNQTD